MKHDHPARKALKTVLLQCHSLSLYLETIGDPRYQLPEGLLREIKISGEAIRKIEAVIEKLIL